MKWLIRFLQYSFNFENIGMILLIFITGALMIQGFSIEDEYLLSTPHSRVKIIMTQGLYALFSMLVLFILVFLVGFATSEMMFPGQLDAMQYYDSIKLVQGADTIGINLVYLIGALTLLGASVLIFNRKRLPL